MATLPFLRHPAAGRGPLAATPPGAHRRQTTDFRPVSEASCSAQHPRRVASPTAQHALSCQWLEPLRRRMLPVPALPLAECATEQVAGDGADCIQRRRSGMEGGPQWPTGFAMSMAAIARTTGAPRPTGAWLVRSLAWSGVRLLLDSIRQPTDNCFRCCLGQDGSVRVTCFATFFAKVHTRE